MGSTHSVTNENAADRAYHIAASVRINESGELEGFEGGSVASVPDMRHMATFNSTMSGSLRVEFSCTSTEQGEVLDAINGFIADLKQEGGEV